MENEMICEKNFTFDIKVQEPQIYAELGQLTQKATTQQIIAKINLIEDKIFKKTSQIQSDIEKLKEYILLIGQKFNFKNEPTNNQRFPKKIRRTAQKIQRNFKCPIINCKRAYGSHSSLKCHIKLKHRQTHINDLQQQENLSSNNLDSIDKLTGPYTKIGQNFMKIDIQKQMNRVFDTCGNIQVFKSQNNIQRGYYKKEKGAFKKFQKN